MTLWIIAGLVLLSLLAVGLVVYLAVALDIEHVRHRQRIEDAQRLLPDADAARHIAEQTSPLTQAEPETTVGAVAADEVFRVEDAPPAFPEPETVGADAGGETDVYALAWAMDDFFNRSSQPKDLLAHEKFLKGVEMLRGEAYTTEDLLSYSRGPNVVVGCMALEALARGDGADDISASLLSGINDYYYWPRYFALRALDARARRPILAELLARVNASWREFVPAQALREFVAGRLAAGETVSLDDLLEHVSRNNLSDEQVGDVANVLDDLGDALSATLREEFARWRGERVDLEFLKSFGRVWEPRGEEGGEVVLLDPVAERVRELETALTKEPARSVLLVGDSGVGKTATLRALARRLQRERWTVFQASAGDVMSGQQYIGQLEGRVQSLVRQIGGKRVLWVIPNFHETLWAGRHQYSPTGVLDLLLPHVESGLVKVVGEVPTAAYEQLVRLRPKLRAAMQTCRVAPLGDSETLELGRRWAASATTAETSQSGKAAGVGAATNDNSSRVRRISEETLQEAFQLAKQYLGDKAAPGNLLLFLEATRRRMGAEGEGQTREITLDDLLVTLSQLTGLPVSILDEREGLDLAELRAFFERRVLGQPEAVDCLIERVAMIKAGLTDPTRPQGVFLFVGPTGTGKTEIAKTLAEFLFGSPERMIRLDMSEFQTPESLDRVLGESQETSESAALVNLIRKQPFSVVLLDEFEKAHSNVWDLFLQVFDDGRLTDRRGNTADFRHCVVIMTSNLGATLPHGATVGFSGEQARFTSAGVERAVGRSFRREFVNRIDRVVVFRPLGLGVMRELLRKELNDVLRRRGLRMRQWAVEWDESAIEFLLHKGFTADLGARPLKRAVERYVLSPLALTIVNHQFPEGDQFLFVRSAPDGESIAVQFVDPDAPEEELKPDDAAELLEETESAGGELRLEAIALDARGTPDEVQFLQRVYRELSDRTEAEEWRERKSAALEATQAPGFWDSPGRFSVLGLAEYMDRIEAGLDTAGSLLARLTGSRDRRQFPPGMVARVAEQLYLVGTALKGLAAGEPRDAFLSVRASREAGADGATSDRLARRLTAMYRNWAEKRRMRFELLEEREDVSGDNDEAGARRGYRALVAVSGFGAYSILRPEAGLHVLETPQDEKSFNRAKAIVSVVAQPDEPAGHGDGALRRQAERALVAPDAGTTQAVVRRYREEPSPLVRDSARGWRTGKIERVLGGDFDLIS